MSDDMMSAGSTVMSTEEFERRMREAEERRMREAEARRAFASETLDSRSVPAANARPTGGLPYGLPPAPKRARRVSPPIDMGTYDENYAGWCIVFDLDVGLQAYEVLAQAQDANGVESLKLMREWMAQVVLAWNFTVTELNGEQRPMRQPSEGGIVECPPAVLNSVASAFGDALKPVKSVDK